MDGRSDRTLLLRRALQANAAFSLASGVGMLAFAGTLANIMGFPYPAVLSGVGAVLMLFGAGVLLVALRRRTKLGHSALVLAADIGWVFGSVILLAAAPHLFDADGQLIVALVAAAVAAFGVLEAVGLRRARRLEARA